MDGDGKHFDFGPERILFRLGLPHPIYLGLLESRDPTVNQERQRSVAAQELGVSLNPSSTTYGLCDLEQVLDCSVPQFPYLKSWLITMFINLD